MNIDERSNDVNLPEFGARPLSSGGVRFSLWAPEAAQVELLVGSAGSPEAVHTVAADTDGWHNLTLPDLGAGALYRWRINGELPVPDPASRFNPEGPHGASEVIDPDAFAWDDGGWQGRPWSEAVLYEMHIGTFTPEGTYRAAETRLKELADTGITAVELMPLSDFPGRFGWGYDGVLPFAPHAAYGRPDDLKHFIQSAHKLGLMVFMDVVYNHFGPDGNYLGVYASQFFSPTHTNPWGNSLNFDNEGSAQVRAFFIRNALHWLDEYRCDGLRLDAVHAIVDDSTFDILDELAHTVKQAISDREVHLVLENENNDHQRLPGSGGYDAQWNDDFHHVMHAALTGDGKGYYQDYAKEPIALLARSLAQGFLWEGSKRTSDGARTDLREAPPQPLGAMVNFLNNHDQSGNRAFGERMHAIAPLESMHLATAIMLLSPAVPMLFQGEEYGATSPFLYFADWDGDLKDAVTDGRLRDFGHFAERADGGTGEPPPPCEESTFAASKLDWTEAEQPQGKEWRSFVTGALKARREWFQPRAADLISGAHSFHMLDDRTFVLRWRYAQGEVIELAAHFSALDRQPVADLQPWSELHGVQEIFGVGSLNDTHWGEWSARWRFGREA